MNWWKTVQVREKMAKCSCSAIIEYVLIGLVTQRTHSLTEIVRRYVTKPNDSTVSVAPMHFILLLRIIQTIETIDHKIPVRVWINKVFFFLLK